jgi:hypothetical protein
MKIVPNFDSEFPIVQEGIHLFVIEDARVEAKENGKFLAKITSRAKGGPSDGIIHFENFGWTAGSDEFGVQRFAGFLVKTGVITPEKCDTDLFESEAFRNRIKEKLVGKAYGAKIIHKKTNQGNVMSNSVAYYTAKETPKDARGNAGMPKQETKTQETKTVVMVMDEKDDDWT